MLTKRGVYAIIIHGSVGQAVSAASHGGTQFGSHNRTAEI